MKRCLIRPIEILVVLTLFHLVFPQRACAYLDPGTGSYLLQMLLAALLGGLFAVKLFWNQIKDVFKKLFSRDRECEEHEEESKR